MLYPVLLQLLYVINERVLELAIRTSVMNLYSFLTLNLLQ